MEYLFLDSAPDDPEWMAVLNNMDGHRPGLASPPLPPPLLPSSSPAISRPFYRPCKSTPTTMKEMIYSVAALTPVRINRELLKARPRRNVRISKDPQSVVARRRRRRIGERFRMLQQLVPGGAGMDTASMLDEAIRYVKFLQEQVRRLEALAAEDGWRGADFGGGINYSVYQAAGGALHLDLAPMLS